MLARFEVENFRGFKDRLILDLRARTYEFNSQLVKNGLVKNLLIYGRNGSGKSSLGLAIFDIIRHLTDKNQVDAHLLDPYTNLFSSEKVASFRYEFRFEEGAVLYQYEKNEPDDLCHEALWFGEELVLDWNYLNPAGNTYRSDILGEIDLAKRDKSVSVLKYVYRTRKDAGHVLLARLMRFAENMLWYRSLILGPSYAGFQTGSDRLTAGIVKQDKVRELEDFLRENGLDYHLAPATIDGKDTIIARFGNGKEAQLMSLASSGTRSLMLFFYWSVFAFDTVSLLFVDEFDAYIHFESSRAILERLNNVPFQVMLTTHNTYLMQNALTRPDACFLLGGNRMVSLCDATDKEIRLAHNLEKMYTHGVFRE